jgi:S-adenosylmethionine:diacylglycerol 3-amino-3-carboxypropyl transferase
MYAQTDIHCDGVVYPQGSEVDASDVGDAYDALVEAGALGENHPAISDNPAAVEALRAQSEQLSLTQLKLAAALARLEELEGGPVDLEVVDTTTAGNNNVVFAEDPNAAAAGDTSDDD